MMNNLTAKELINFFQCVKTYQNTSKDALRKAGFSKSSRWTNLKLYDQSRVLEFGGYKGGDTEQILKRFQPKQYIVFEPIPKFAGFLHNKFHKYSNVKIYNFGVGTSTEVVLVSNKRDGTSVFKTLTKNDTKFETIHILSIDYILNQKIHFQNHKFDLLMMNCEGCEYEVLDYLFTSPFLSYFRAIQFQSHRIREFKTEMVRKYCTYQELFQRTHVLKYQFKFIWELWILKQKV